MVNPLKHSNNLNPEDLELIYNRLCIEYERARDFNNKKRINQQILIMILLCRRFPVQDLVKITYDFFESEPSKSILHKHLKEQSMNNYCDIKGLLLTNRQNKALNIDDVEKIVSGIDTGCVNKELTVNSLNISKSLLNDFGKMNYNKKRIKKFLELKNTIKVIEESIQENEDNKVSQEDKDSITKEITDNVSNNLQSYLDENIRNEYYTSQLDQIKENQDILEDSLTNKYNQLSNTVSKIHQNVKASNKKYDKFQEYFNEIGVLKDSLNTHLESQNTKLSQIEDKFDEVLDKIEEVGMENPQYIPREYSDEVKNMLSRNVISNKFELVPEYSYLDYKEFMYDWFNKNIKVTKNPHDTIDMKEITGKLDKFLEKHDTKMDKSVLCNRLESYLSYWYNQHEVKVPFNDIKSESINGNEFYSNLKFINIKEERENRIKNSIKAWLVENTCEVEGSKTYTQDIFDRVEPIFKENGWIITTPEEWRELHNAGFSKVVANRTFSQIIGKAVQDVYQFISIDTIQRDSPKNTGNVTWYPNIEILDKNISGDLHSKITHELSSDIFESDNIIYNWLKDNLVYTSKQEDKLSISLLLEKIIKYLQIHEVKISEKSLETVFNERLNVFLNDYDVVMEDNQEITGFKIGFESDEKLSNIITDWIENHIIITDNSEDKTYLDDINEKILSTIYHEGINVVNDTLYSQLPSDLKTKCTTQSQLEKNLKTALSKKTAEKVDDIDGICYEGIQIIKYKALKQEHITTWLNNNIDELLKANIVPKKNVINEFMGYINEHNIKNTTQHSINELLYAGLSDYYSKRKDVSFEVLKELEDEYYALIST